MLWCPSAGCALLVLGVFLVTAETSTPEYKKCPYAEAAARVKRQEPQPPPQPTTPPPPAPTPINTNAKPPDDRWIRGFRPEEKLGLVQWLLRGCWAETGKPACGYQFRHVEYPGYDGWYNNPAHPELGAVDTPLLRRVKPWYDDSVYKPVVEGRPNPFTLSENLMKGNIGSQSRTGKTALLVFFGQQMVEEILDAQRPACPPEYFNIPIPKDHEYLTQRPMHSEMPLLRTRYDMRTGFSPGNPRQQLNEITPWLDGGLTYGISKGWADQLRRYKDGTVDPDGQLAFSEGGLFPEYNTHRLPLANPPPPANHSQYVKNHETAKVSRFFKLGNPRGNENPFLLTFGVMWFRWHNVIARELRTIHKDWSSERIFNEARKWVIATHQKIVIYDWLPKWLGRHLDEYTGYNPALDPQIDQFFQSAAMRFGHTLVTPGVWLRDYVRNGCGLIDYNGFQTVRTCNFFWRPQEPMLHPVPNAHGGGGETGVVDIDRLLMGMATQLTEEEDHIIVEDLRGRVFGPLEFSRRDLMAINIQRARDHGLPDYNTARAAYGLGKVTDESHFIASDTIKATLKSLYTEALGKNTTAKWYDHIDVWVGGLLETGDSPGELFNAIIRDQFTRIRNADRFWFENAQNGLFTAAEVNRIRQITIRDVIMSVTHMESHDIQRDPFLAPLANEMHTECHKNTAVVTSRFRNGSAGVEHRVLPALTADRVEACVPANTYDYFSNSETSFILTFFFLSLAIAGFVALLFGMSWWKQKQIKNVMQSRAQHKVQFQDSSKASFSVHEWVGKREGFRPVLVLLNSAKRQIEVCSQMGMLQRAVDITHCKSFDIFIATDGLHLLLRVTNDYDLVLRFDSPFIRDSFLLKLEDFINELGVQRTRITIQLNALQRQAVTRAARQKRLEMFFRVVFSQAFNIEHNEEEILRIDANVAREVIYTELTISEFAEELGMRADSEFVIKMFALVDKDKNGFISFREFVDMLVIFSKGSADDKAKLMFDMYDINGTGHLTRQDFVNMIKSLVETANADVKQQDLESVVSSMMMAAGLTHKDTIQLQDFQRLLRDHKDKIDFAQFNVGGTHTPATTSNRNSFAGRARETVISIYGNPLDWRDGAKEEPRSNIALDTEDAVFREVKTEKSKLPPFVIQTLHFFENYRLQIFWCTIYTLVLIAIFIERAYYYSVEREHAGLRRIAGYGVTVTRGAASAMMFTYSSLLVTMCRNTITRLRDTFLHLYIPFDSAVDMHKYIAAWALFFTIMHSIGHAINFYHISTQTSNDLTCLFRNFFHATHELPKFHYWCWQTITGVTGVALAILTALIFTFSLPYTRHHLYDWFWITHSLYPVFYLLCILHGAGRLVQEPFFHYFFIGPCILYILDSLVSMSRKKIEIPVIRAELLPSDVTMLEFKRPSDFDYKSGQWMRIACPSLNSGEYHPFTISSAPHEKNLTLHIRAVGPWTWNLRRLYDPSNICDNRLPKILLDGPYGESHQDWYQYDVSVLVGAGIGVTPFASILKDIIYNANSIVASTAACKKVYFLWVTKTQKHFEWLVDILRDLENADAKLVVSVHIFITQFYEKYDLRTILLYICERHFQRICNRSLFTGLKAVTHFGRPNCDKIFRGIRETHSKVRKIGVFSCGPLPLTQQVERACAKINSTASDGPLYQHHYENF